MKYITLLLARLIFEPISYIIIASAVVFIITFIVFVVKKLFPKFPKKKTQQQPGRSIIIINEGTESNTKNKILRSLMDEDDSE